MFFKHGADEKVIEVFDRQLKNKKFVENEDELQETLEAAKEEFKKAQKKMD